LRLRLLAMLPAGLIEVDRWLGLRGDALTPSAMLFVAVERDGTGCRSCIFAGQRVAVCKAACELASRAGQRDCDSPTDPGKRIIYVAPPNDPRQLELLEK